MDILTKNFNTLDEAVQYLKDVGFNDNQLKMLNMGFACKIDPTIYFHLHFNEQQMEQILFGLINDLDVSSYAIEGKPWEEMEKERLILKQIKEEEQKKRWAVHITHCCALHGCKYGNEDCPIVMGNVKQDFPCEYCNGVTIKTIEDVETFLEAKKALKYAKEYNFKKIDVSVDFLEKALSLV